MAEISAPGKKEIAPASAKNILPEDPVSPQKKSKGNFFRRRVNKDSVSQVRTAPGELETHEKKKKSFKSKASSFFKGKKSDTGDKAQRKERLNAGLEAPPDLEEERAGGDSLRRHERTRHESLTSNSSMGSPPDEATLDDALALNLQRLNTQLQRAEKSEPSPNRQDWPVGSWNNFPPPPPHPHPPLPPSPPLSPSPLRGKKTSAFPNPLKKFKQVMGFAKSTKDKRDGFSQSPQVSVHSSHNGKFAVLRMQGPSRQGSQESLASSRHSAWSDFLFVLPAHKAEEDRGVRDLLPSLAERTRIQRKYPNAEIISSGASAPPQRPPQDPDGGGIVNRIRSFFLKIFRPGEYTRRCEVYLAYERDILAMLVREQERYQQTRFAAHAERDAQAAEVAELFKQYNEKKAREVAQKEGAVGGATPLLDEGKK